MADEDHDQEHTLNEGETLKDLRDAAARSKEHKAAANAAQRELAFLKAGLKVDDPIVKHVMDSYDGELTTEAVNARAKELGLERLTAGTTSTETTDPNPDDGDTSQTDARKALTDGATAPSSTDTSEDPRDKGLKEFQKALNRGENRKDASGAFFQELFDAAARGDKRVLVARDTAEKAEERATA